MILPEKEGLRSKMIARSVTLYHMGLVWNASIGAYFVIREHSLKFFGPSDKNCPVDSLCLPRRIIDLVNMRKRETHALRC